MALALLAALKTLPYSSSWFVQADAEFNREPSHSGFHVGPLVWDLDSYRDEARLQPLRTYFSARCAGQSGAAAAICISMAFSREFPFGNPRGEFVDSNYDPISDLEAHHAGEPGHCVTRSGLVCAVLLASGIPCRVLQMIPWDPPNGHNVSEVWDPALGWIIVDGTYMGVLAPATRSSRASANAVTVQYRFESFSPEPMSAQARVIYSSNGGWLTGERIYPEPWLYMRSGKRYAPWPFRGAFARVQPISWRYGLGQRVFEFSAALAALASLAVFLNFRSSRLVRRRLVEPASPAI